MARTRGGMTRDHCLVMTFIRILTTAIIAAILTVMVVGSYNAETQTCTFHGQVIAWMPEPDCARLDSIHWSRGCDNNGPTLLGVLQIYESLKRIEGMHRPK